MTARARTVPAAVRTSCRRLLVDGGDRGVQPDAARRQRPGQRLGQPLHARRGHADAAADERPPDHGQHPARGEQRRVAEHAGQERLDQRPHRPLVEARGQVAGGRGLRLGAQPPRVLVAEAQAEQGQPGQPAAAGSRQPGAAAAGRPRWRRGSASRCRPRSSATSTAWSKNRRSSDADVDEVGQRRVGGVDHLEAAVEQEAVDPVGRDPAAEPGRRLQQHHLGAGGGQRGGPRPARPRPPPTITTSLRRGRSLIASPREIDPSPLAPEGINPSRARASPARPSPSGPPRRCRARPAAAAPTRRAGGSGSRSSRRAQAGSSATAVAASSAYGPRASSGSGGFQTRNRAASRASGIARSSGRYPCSAASSSCRRRGGSVTPSASRDAGGVGDVAVAAGRVQRLRAVALVAAQEAVGLGHVHPAQQVRVARPVGQAAWPGPGDVLVHPPHAVDRRAGRPRRCRTWWPRGRCSSAAAGPTGRCGSRSAARPRSSPAGAATAAAAPAGRRRTSRRPRAPAGSAGRRRTSAGPAC